MTCSTKSLKILALIADVIYAIIGFSIIALGVYILWKLDLFNIAAYSTIAVGIVVLLTAIFGCVGASKESSRITKTYVVILILLIVVQLLGMIFSWIFQSTLLINVDAKFDQLWRNQTVPITPETPSPIASLERWLECCGSSSDKDYLHAPYSCFTNNKVLNTEGCRQKFLDYISDRWLDFNIFGLILIGVEMFCAALSYILANSIINRWRRSKYYTK